MLILNVRAKIWDFFNVQTQKWVRPKRHWNAILVLFEYINLVKCSKKILNFVKWRLRRRTLRARKSENPEFEVPLSARNPAIDPPQGVRYPIISSAWTFRRARTRSYASLPPRQKMHTPPGIQNGKRNRDRKTTVKVYKEEGGWGVIPPGGSIYQGAAKIWKNEVFEHFFGNFWETF